MKKNIQIGTRTIGDEGSCFLIAEVGQAHDGSLGMAHAYIDAAAEAGVDAIKFQLHIAEAESTIDEPFRTRFSMQDDTRYSYWQRMEFTFEQWKGLTLHAKEKGLIILISPFSIQAIRMLEKLEIPAWKIGSGETVSKDLLETILETKQPILVSTGMSTVREIDNLVKMFHQHKAEFALLQCTSKYPVEFSEIGLNIIQELKARYACPVGLSDHSGSVFPGLAAMAQGASIIEAHIVFDKRMFGPDTQASLTVEDFKLLVNARNAFNRMFSNPMNKDKMAEKLRQTRIVFGKSMALVNDLPAGTILNEEMLTAKKPGTGIPLQQKKKLIGKKLINDVPKIRLLRWEDLDG